MAKKTDINDVLITIIKGAAIAILGFIIIKTLLTI